MIKDNLLENRLNAVKEGKPVPSPSKGKNSAKVNQDHSNYNSPKYLFINELYKLFQVIATSLLYGYGFSAIFSMDWNFIQVLGVGLIANHFIFNLFSTISKLFKK